MRCIDDEDHRLLQWPPVARVKHARELPFVQEDQFSPFGVEPWSIVREAQIRVAEALCHMTRQYREARQGHIGWTDQLRAVVSARYQRQICDELAQSIPRHARNAKLIQVLQPRMQEMLRNPDEAPLRHPQLAGLGGADTLDRNAQQRAPLTLHSIAVRPKSGALPLTGGSSR